MTDQPMVRFNKVKKYEKNYSNGRIDLAAGI